jgi:hypothetical protein
VGTTTPPGSGSDTSGETAEEINASASSGTGDTDTNLPDTGGLPIGILGVGLVALTSGALLIRARRIRGIDRA